MFIRGEASFALPSGIVALLFLVFLTDLHMYDCLLQLVAQYERVNSDESEDEQDNTLQQVCTCNYNNIRPIHFSIWILKQIVLRM